MKKNRFSEEQIIRILKEAEHARLLDLKEDAIALLLPLLADQRSAPLAGSQDATTSTRYKNRVCDYAWVFICEIRQRAFLVVGTIISSLAEGKDWQQLWQSLGSYDPHGPSPQREDAADQLIGWVNQKT